MGEALHVLWVSPVAQMVESLPAVRETRVHISGWGRSPVEGNGNSLQCACLENPMEGVVWQATIHRVAKSWTQLSNLKKI